MSDNPDEPVKSGSTSSTEETASASSGSGHAVKASGNMGTTAESTQAPFVENTEDKPPRPQPKPTGGSLYARIVRALLQPDKPPGAPADSFDHATEWLMTHGALPALALITIGVFAIHARIFTGETAGDDLSFHFAESARLMDCLRGFDFDFWNPSANGGFASAYYYQVLPQLASALPAAIFGHHLFWFQLSVVLPLVAAPVCAYKGMRLLGATPWQATIAAFCVAFMNGASRWGAGNAGSFVVGLYTQTWALCAFPLALGYAVQWVTKGKHLAAAIAWGAFVFLCHPFAGITLGLAVAAGWFAQLVLIPFDYLFAWIAPKLTGKLAWLGKRWEERPKREVGRELVRAGVLALAFGVTWMPIWLPLLIDREGFGGFPHRVGDEVGPGFKQLGLWWVDGQVLDWSPQNQQLGTRLGMLTWSFPLILLFARASFYRWLWAPAFTFALLLGLGPHIGKIGDDLFPPVRALGAMQTVLAMGIGAGALLIGQWIWVRVGRWPTKAYAIRTVIAAAAAAAIVLIVVPGSKALGARVRVLGEQVTNRADELHIINAMLAKQPQGRKQTGPGAENHWWNLLSYAYQRVPSTLQMGGGGLQASPNYDFLWWLVTQQRDYVKTAWIFDAPYLTFMTTLGSKLPVGETVGKTLDFEIRKLPSPGLVSPVRVTAVLPPGYRHNELGHKKALEWLRGDQPMQDEVLAYKGWSDGNMNAPAGRAIRSWRQDSPGSDPDIVAELDVQRTTTFTVRESWHPRWHAYVDDEEVPVRRVTPDFIAVDVTSGQHTLAVRFERPWWMHAAWLAWPLTALLGWWLSRTQRFHRLIDWVAARPWKMTRWTLRLVRILR